MGLDKDQIRVASKGQVFVAPAGTALPTTEESVLNGAFVGLGYTTEEGVTLNYEQETEGIKAWQRKGDIRKIVTARNLSVGFQGMQWNADTFALAFGGGEWTEVEPGHHRYDPPGGEDSLTEYAMVLDFQDGDVKFRLVIERGSISDSVETNLVNNAAAVLPVTFAALEVDDEEDRPWFLLTSDAGLDIEGS